MKKGRAQRRVQVAALPVRRGAGGAWEVLLLTSRQTRRWIIPKGWPIKGVHDCIAAAREAREEAGLLGCVRKRSVGSYEAWKRHDDSFEFVTVRVYRFDVDEQLNSWPEADQRSFRWVKLSDAAHLVEEPGLSKLLRRLIAAGDGLAD